MQTSVIIQQMIMIFLLIAIGVILHRTKLIKEDGSKQISNIILKVTNPALLLTSSLSGTDRISNSEFVTGVIFYIIMYLSLIVLSFIIPMILRIEKSKRYSYIMMTIFGNVGFIGIPLATEVLGADSLIYVSVCNLFFSIIIYTFGISVFEKTVNKTKENRKKGFHLPGWINVGTICACITVILYTTGQSLPQMLNDVLSYAGRSTTFLSMLVLGVSVSTMNPKKVFTNLKLYIFVIIRLVIVPIVMITIFKLFTDSPMLISSLTLMCSISFANMPLMFAKSYGVNDEDISGGIILSTIMSLITIPIVSMLVL